MNLEPFTGPGSTPSRRRFWDKVAAAVTASQKVAGKNVSVAEHQGMGTLINVNRGSGGVGACCLGDGLCLSITEAECATLEGSNFQGVGTVCDPNPCTMGACCEDADCSITTEEECSGVYHGDGTVCDPNPCDFGACCVDPDCSIETRTDCAELGGLYYGFGTTCEDHPCGTCCGETFAGFVTPTNRYWTKTIHATLVDECVPECFECTRDFDVTSIFDWRSCSEVITCEGECHYTDNSHDQTGEWVLVGDHCEFDPTCNVCVGCLPIVTVVDSDTQTTGTCDYDVGCCSSHVVITTTLSNPCIPE